MLLNFDMLLYVNLLEQLSTGYLSSSQFFYFNLNKQNIYQQLNITKRDCSEKQTFYTPLCVRVYARIRW